MKKIKITIGIPAYNEESNLGRILNEIFNQSRSSYILEKIIIVLDGSTDSSFKIVNSFKCPIINIINSSVRKGKPARINQIFGISDTEILVTIDADVHIKENHMIDLLISPLIYGNRVALTSGYAIPSAPKNIIQDVAISGVNIWNYARKISPNSQMYYTEGQIRAYRKVLYKKIIFPNTSADDVYPYIYSQVNNFEFTHCPQAVVVYELPLKLRDYIKQQIRYLQSPLIQEKHFGTSVIKKYFTIGNKSRMKATINELIKRPVPTILYLLIWAYVKIRLLFMKNNFSSLWEILYSTKKIYT